MTPEPAGGPPRSRGRLALGLAIACAGLAAAALLLGGGEGANDPPRASDADSVTSAPAPTGAAKPLPEGAIRPILGPPRGGNVAYCDERHWPNLGDLVVAVRDAEVVVDEPAWNGHGTATQGGLASWLSKCRLGGRPVTIVARDSGRVLGTYATESGYRRDG